MSYDIGATHVPVLISIGTSLRIERVLELGAGWYSTSTFLNPRVFPHLKTLVSFEDDPIWFQKVGHAHFGDHRLIQVDEFPLLTDPYDLVFVDNSTSGAVRAETIRKVSEECLTGLVVIHDAEDHNYIPEIARFKKSVTIKTYEKWTALATNDANMDLPDFAWLIEGHLHLDPNDVDGWLNI